jgi:hypothetical protein
MSEQATMRRTIVPDEVRMVEEKTGICEYIASDESLDSSNEVIRVSGWKFDRMAKNAPFINSHNYRGIDNLVGKVLGARTENNQLIESVQWAVDVPENRLAQLGWAMTKAGYLKAVSVGFLPMSLLTRLPHDEWSVDWGGASITSVSTRAGKDAWAAQQDEMGVDLSQVMTIYTSQMQTELSACVVGANPNAVAKSYKAGIITDADLDLLATCYAISAVKTKSETADATADPADVAKARQRAQFSFRLGIETRIKGL